jgi:long-chain acyl-CoA synthetase
MYQELITRRLKDVSHFEQVQKFTLLTQGFTIESGMLTPTLKVRRSVVAKTFAKEIEAMYTDATVDAGTP